LLTFFLRLFLVTLHQPSAPVVQEGDPPTLHVPVTVAPTSGPFAVERPGLAVRTQRVSIYDRGPSHLERVMGFKSHLTNWPGQI
jgi:hypothetical protein